MASVYRRKNSKTGKHYEKWYYRYEDWQGQTVYGVGYSDKRETKHLVERLELESREIRLGHRPAPEAAENEVLKPIQEHIDAYLAWGEAQGGRKGHPWSKVHARKVEARLAFWVKELRLKTLKDVSQTRVESTLQKLRSGGLSGKSLNHAQSVINAFLRWCVERKKLAAMPWDKLRKFDESVRPENRRRALTLEEVGRLLAISPEIHSIVYETAITTGLRAGELASLRCGDFLRDRPAFLLRGEYAKDRLDAEILVGRGVWADPGDVA